MILRARRGGWWDAGKIGLAVPHFGNGVGWLLIYHGVADGVRLSLPGGLGVLMDRQRPERCLRRGDAWVLGPEANYERFGQRRQRGLSLRLHHRAGRRHGTAVLGAADACIALATGSIRQHASSGWTAPRDGPEPGCGLRAACVTIARPDSFEGGTLPGVARP